MDSIQTKIAALKKDRSNLESMYVSPGSLCNISVSSGRAIIALQYKMSPLEVTDIMKVDREAPKGIYCIAIPPGFDTDILGREIILDMSYGAKGVALSHKIINLDKKLIDVLGGEANFKIIDGHPALNNRSKLIIGEDNKVEFWECNLINLNQIGGIICY